MAKLIERDHYVPTRKLRDMLEQEVSTRRRTSNAKGLEMNRSLLFLILITSLAVNSISVLAQVTADIEHVIVYYEDGRAAGWPANHGIWSWGDEIVVGFDTGYLQNETLNHDLTRPIEDAIARSLDGGKSWTVEIPEGIQPPNLNVENPYELKPGPMPQDSPGGVPFEHPDFLLKVRMDDHQTGPSFFYWSIDRGRTWNGPFWVPDFGQPGIISRTDYIVDGPGAATVFLTASTSYGESGYVIAVRTTDGAKTWELLSLVTQEQRRAFSIQPSTVRISETEMLMTLRWQGREDARPEWSGWIDSYRTHDNGHTWEPAGWVTETFNPPSMLRLNDGRIVITYGYRKEPFGIRARISTDNGHSWSAEIMLREDGDREALGYTRTVQRLDGKLVTVYYFNDVSKSELYIAATIWDPGQ